MNKHINISWLFSPIVLHSLKIWKKNYANRWKHVKFTERKNIPQESIVFIWREMEKCAPEILFQWYLPFPGRRLWYIDNKEMSLIRNIFHCWNGCRPLSHLFTLEEFLSFSAVFSKMMKVLIWMWSRITFGMDSLAF